MSARQRFANSNKSSDDSNAGDSDAINDKKKQDKEAEQKRGILIFFSFVLLGSLNVIIGFLKPNFIQNDIRLTVSATSIGFFMIMASFPHFTNPRFYLGMMPPFLPSSFNLFLVYVSGVLEFLFGALVAYPPMRTEGAFFILLLLIAVTPANIQCVISSTTRRATGIPFVFAVIRIPIQLIFFTWAYQLIDQPIDEVLFSLRTNLGL